MPKVAVVGGGIAGLLLALGLKTKLGITAAVYEQAPAFDEEVGGAIGLYANGQRVIRDISPKLHAEIRAAGVPFVYRRWLRHDGSEVAVGRERCLLDASVAEDEAAELSSLGIRRWRLQKALRQAADDARIPLVFGKRVEKVEDLAAGPAEPYTKGAVLHLSDGTSVTVDLVFGCDGLRSAVRTSLFGKDDPPYTGVTCLMGSAKMPRCEPGICFPSSSTTRCHACFYPTGANEQVFQIFLNMPEMPETWGPVSPEEERKLTADVADRFAKNGWHSQFYEPIRNGTGVLRTGLRAREPIRKWHVGNVVLLGDAAHPPVPYIGQGAMMAAEDVGILLLLLEKMCCDRDAKGNSVRFDMSKLPEVFRLYEELRIPRTTTMHRNSVSLGSRQLRRAELSPGEIAKDEQRLIEEVAAHGTLPVLFSGARYDYRAEAQKAAEEAALFPPGDVL